MEEYVFKLPDAGEGTAEAEIAAWRVAVGDSLQEDQPLVEVITDKATVEITSPILRLRGAAQASARRSGSSVFDAEFPKG